MSDAAPPAESAVVPGRGPPDAPSPAPHPDGAWRLPAIALPLLLHLVLVLALAPYHTTLTASVEADFPGYVAHALGSGDEIVWDGFVPCGYPRLLAWTSAVVGNRFLSGVLLSAIGGSALVALSYALARLALPPRAASFAAGALAVNWLVLQGSLLAGTDSLWAAALVGVVVLLAHARRRDSRDLHVAAGVLLGASYLLRYATLAVVPAVVAAVALDRGRGTERRRWAHAAAFLVAALAASSPQWILAGRDAGSPFASFQAKNVWFGIHGDRDWRRHWGDVPDDVPLLTVIGDAPGAFVANLAENLVKFLAQCVAWPLGVSPESVAESPRLAAAPVLLAAAALSLGGGLHATARLRSVLANAVRNPDVRLAAATTLVYGAAVSCAFWFPRFFLPVLPFVTVGGALALRATVWPRLRERPGAARLLPAAFLVFCASHSVSAWGTFLDRRQQPVEEVRVALLAGGLREGDVVATTTLQHYDSVLPFPFVEVPLGAADLDDLQQVLAESDARFLLYEEQTGSRGSYRPGLDVLLDDPHCCPFLEPFYVRPGPRRLVLFRAH